MALIRPLAGLVLLSALVAGCSQSLFANPGDGDDDGGNDERDGGNEPLPDAGPPGPKPDAGMPSACPAPCVANAVAEFAATQGGATGKWGYYEEQPDPFGFAYGDLALGDVDGLEGWISPSTPRLAIASCPANPGAPQCAGIEDKLVFMTTSNDPGTSHPSLTWRARRRTRAPSG